jgi:ABC-type sugar transport system ATPase subunit
MKIKKVYISNYLTFDEISLYLNDFQVITGQNGSGRRNLTKVFDLFPFVQKNIFKLNEIKKSIVSDRNFILGKSKDTIVSILTDKDDEISIILSNNNLKVSNIEKLGNIKVIDFDNDYEVFAVIDNFIESEKFLSCHKEFKNLLTYVFPHIKDIIFYKDRGVSNLKIKYFYYNKLVSDISQGEKNVIALISLYFSNYDVLVISYPERGIYYQNYSKIAEILLRIAQKSQVIVITNTPFIFDSVPKDRFYIMKRNELGFSVIEKAKS